MEHDWREILSAPGYDVDQCTRCQVIRSNGTFFHRGQETEDPGCADNKPIPLDRILSDERTEARLGRKVWLLLHWNVPLTHVDTVLLGLSELIPDKRELFLEALATFEESMIGALTLAFNNPDPDVSNTIKEVGESK